MDKSNTTQRWKVLNLFRPLLATFGLFALILINACGGGTSVVNQGDPNMGIAMVTLTDAPGDFLSYEVTVTSLQLTREDGTVVQTLTHSTPVDFVQLVNLSEIISAAQVPKGKYVSASLTLDYSAAAIVVDNGVDGLTVPAANILDSNGATLSGPVTMTLTFPSGRPFVVSERTVSNLALDFNLLATNVVVPNPITDATLDTEVMVTVNPTLSASLVPDQVKQIRVRGPLVSVDAAASTYTIHVRPFYNSEGLHGDITVNTTDATTFAVDGIAYNNVDGLAALEAKGTDTLTVAYGLFDVASGTFTASNVLVGTSVNGSSDSVEGTVLARDGATLTIGNNVSHSHRHHKCNFNRRTTVTLGESTAVTKDGQTDAFTWLDVSVGQHIQVFGSFGSDDSDDWNGRHDRNRTLDATAGSVRLMVTPLVGTVTSISDTMVTVRLKSLDGQKPSKFDFAGTGSSAENDAIASAFVVNVPSSLPVSNLNGRVTFYGFVSPYGAAPPNFNAITVVGVPSTGGGNTITTAQVLLGFANDGDVAPFTPAIDASSTSLTISQASLQGAAFGKIKLGSDYTDTATLSNGLTIEFNSSAAAPQFVIAHRGSLSFESFASFGDMVTALATGLNGTTGLLGLYASGTYDSATGVLSADVLLIALSD